MYAMRLSLTKPGNTFIEPALPQWKTEANWNRTVTVQYGSGTAWSLYTSGKALSVLLYYEWGAVGTRMQIQGSQQGP